MGMYDYLNGEQIKCFYGVVHYKSEPNDNWEFCHSGGQLRGYINNCELPLKTFHYNYPKNFLILDENCGILHTIKDGKLFNTEPLRMVESINNDLLKNVYSYHGLELNINNLDELKGYPAQVSKRFETINKMYKEYKPSSSKLLKAFRLMKDESKNLEDVVLLLEENDYIDLNKLFKSLDIEISISVDSPIKAKMVLKSLLDSKNNKEVTIDFIKNKATELFDRFASREQEEELTLKEFLDPYLNSFNERWIKKDCFKIEKTIGNHISCIKELNELKNNSPEHFNEKDEESYKVLSEGLQDLIKEHGVKSYLAWLNPSKEELEQINSILDKL